MLGANRAGLVLVLLIGLCAGCSDKSTVPEPEPAALAITNCPEVAGSVARGYTWSHSFSVAQEGVSGLSWAVVPTGPMPEGAFAIDSVGVFHFISDSADVNGIFQFRITATADGKLPGECECAVQVMDIEPFRIEIEITHNSLQGHYQYVSVTLTAGSEPMAGFDLSIGYYVAALTFVSAEPGSLIGDEDNNWEYFSYRFGAPGPCSGPCPTGWLNVTAIADLASVQGTPDFETMPGDLATLKFMVTNDRQYECSFLPIRFVWMNPDDNSIASVSGDTLYVATEVRDFEPGHVLSDDCDSGWGISYGGPCPGWDPPISAEPVEFIYFFNGGIDLVCSEPEEYPGDLNLNGIRIEIADYVLYVQYFLHGPTVLDIDIDKQTWESEVNYDGVVLSVGDLVYMADIITGIALPIPHLHPFRDTLKVYWQDDHLSIESPVEVGAIWATFAAGEGYRITNHTQMAVDTGQWFPNEVSVLVWSGADDFRRALPTGFADVFSITGTDRLLFLQASDIEGNMLNVGVNGALMKQREMMRR